MLGLVIVVPPVGLVFANSTLPKPTVTPRKGPKGCCGAGKPASGYALRGLSGTIDLHHLLGHEPRQAAIGGMADAIWRFSEGRSAQLEATEAPAGATSPDWQRLQVVSVM